MNRISIADSRNLLRFACEDLKALKTVVQVVEDQKDWPNEREMLSVVLRALDSIISDFEEGIDSITEGGEQCLTSRVWNGLRIPLMRSYD